MTTDREFRGAVDAWLQEGPTMIPTRVLEAVQAQVPATGQHLATAPVGDAGRRLAPLGLVAVLAATVLIGAAAILGGGASPAPVAVAPTSPTSPTPAPTPAATLGAGTHRTVSDGVVIEVELPAGWASREEGRAFVQQGAAPPAGSFVAFWRVTGIRSDPCVQSTVEPAGPTAIQVADALAKLAGDTATPPVAASFAGYEGVYLELAMPADAACSPVEFTWWVDGTNRRWPIAKGERNRVWILDVAGRPLVVDAGYLPGTPAGDLAALDAVVASIRIEAAD